jgi:CheY-like chemotaxis protein
MARILIIDDDDAVRRTAMIVLQARGFDAVAVDNGQAGVDAVKAGGFDAAIVDLFMPDMDGLTTTRTIRQHSPNMPIVAVSGFMFRDECPNMPNFHPMATAAGATATLYKPFRPNELVQVITDAMAKQRVESCG